MDRSPERRNAVIIWRALAAAPVLFLAVAFAFPLAGESAPDIAQPLLLVLTVAVGVEVAVSWLWAVRMRPAATPTGPALTRERLALTRLIVATALCEGAALFAVVVFMVTRDTRALPPWAIAFAALVSHFPGDRHWARLSREPGAAGTRSNPLMRE
ncbi:conserved hypothetical protein [Anaeromyxobacter dehalogenans 2CP-1]|uniref:Transmembrane protein n=1 Tax=Anaeromyxobacter dehalogenans (strain ATCC BAA-258 / DSM 21875 / 2CP-1) TaxID=455488 RepID=B8JC15_ANAD2|nr:hypothetical protein [Anaeromyxobacter dehalogenans]ACL63937.1 conserved hypothetical protein [Anaeromyxobacter dehalogenans 2CP-1]